MLGPVLNRRLAHYFFELMIEMRDSIIATGVADFRNAEFVIQEEPARMTDPDLD